MVARRLRALLVLLASAVAVVGVAIAAGEGFGRLAAAREAGSSLEARIERLRRAASTEGAVAAARERIAAEVAAKRARLYASGEMNPYSFADLVKNRLASLGISVLRYRVVEADEAPVVEFIASGGIRSFIEFFREASRSAKAWTVSSLALSMREGSDRADATFRIGYAIDGSADD